MAKDRMKRRSFHAPDEQWVELLERAEQTGDTASAIIRRAIGAELKKLRRATAA